VVGVTLNMQEVLLLYVLPNAVQRLRCDLLRTEPSSELTSVRRWTKYKLMRVYVQHADPSCSVDGFMGSNPAGCMDVCILCCVLL
jgi:hypothetical protein